MQRTWLSAVLPLFLLACTNAQKADLNFKNLTTPAGFHISEFGKVDAPRLPTFSPGGTLVVTDSPSGEVVTLPDPTTPAKPSDR